MYMSIHMHGSELHSPCKFFTSKQSIAVPMVASLASHLNLEMAPSFRKGVTASVARVDSALTELTRSAVERVGKR